MRCAKPDAATARLTIFMLLSFLVLAFPVPLAVLGAGVAWQSAALLGLACAVQYVGLLAERWFFFAQANHPQNIYYQAIA